MRPSFFFPLALIGLLFPLCAAAHGSPGFCEDPASPVSAIGAGNGTVTVISGETSLRDCEYWENCDGTFEQAYCWRGSGDALGDPFYGAFAERFCGPAHVEGMRVYITQIGHYAGETQDLFIWGDGLYEPGCVLQMVPDVPMHEVPFWPEIAANDFAIQADVGPEFYVGHQANFDHFCCAWYTAVDFDGPGGDPWTCVSPELGGQHPEGWVHPDEVWTDAHVQAMGIGVYVVTGATVEDFPDETIFDKRTTWGQIKAIYKR